MPSSHKSSLVGSPPDPPPGVELPSDYAAKRCKRCGKPVYLFGQVPNRYYIIIN